MDKLPGSYYCDDKCQEPVPPNDNPEGLQRTSSQQDRTRNTTTHEPEPFSQPSQPSPIMGTLARLPPDFIPEPTISILVSVEDIRGRPLFTDCNVILPRQVNATVKDLKIAFLNQFDPFDGSRAAFALWQVLVCWDGKIRERGVLPSRDVITRARFIKIMLVRGRAQWLRAKLKY